MTPIDIHPDELLAREERGELSPADRTRLDAHLRACPACRVEREARGAFLRETPLDAADCAAVDRIAGRAAGWQPARGRVAYAWASLRLMPAAAAAALLLVVAAGATAAVWAVVRLAAPAQEARDLGQSSSLPSAPPPSAGGLHGPTTNSPSDATSPSTAPREAQTARPADAVAAAPTETRDAGAPGHAPPRRPRASEAPTPPSAEPAAPPTTEATAGAVFAAATAARDRGAVEEAARLYQELATRFHGSREEVGSRVSHGRLLLLHSADQLHRAADALARFDAYLADASMGTLAAEARFGRARALDALGRADDARAAWQELLDRHPDTPYAARARARLGPAP